MPFKVTQNDEVCQWLNGHYVSAPDTVWQLMHFELHKMLSSVDDADCGQVLVTFLSTPIISFFLYPYYSFTSRLLIFYT